MKQLLLSVIAIAISLSAGWGQTGTQTGTESGSFFKVNFAGCDYTYMGPISDSKDEWASKYTMPFRCVIDYQSNTKKEVIVSLYTSKFEGEHYEVVSGLSWWGFRDNKNRIEKILTADDLDDMIKVYEKSCVLEAGEKYSGNYYAGHSFFWEGFCEINGNKIPFRGPVAAVVRDAQTNEIYYLTDKNYAVELTHNHISYIQVKPQIGETSVTLEVSTFFNGEGEGLLILSQLYCYLSGGMRVEDYNKGIDGMINDLNRFSSEYVFAYQKLGRVKANSSIQKFQFELIDRVTGKPFIPDEEQLYDVTFMLIDTVKTYPTGIRSGDVRSKSGFLKKPTIYTANELFDLPNEMEVYVSNNGATLHVCGLEPSDLTCKLFDLSGRLVLQQSIHAPIQTIDINKLSKGIYIIQIGEKKNGVLRQYTRKIVR